MAPEHRGAGRFRLAILISGGGGLMRTAVEACAQGTVPAAVALVVSSRPGSPGIDHARSRGVPTVVIDRKAYGTMEALSSRVWEAIEASGQVDGVALLGWLPFLHIPDRWANRVVNAHPSLLPAFGGKGMIGERVHTAVIASGARVTGLTWHFVDNEYDHGPVIHQSGVEVREDDTPATLQERVVAAQHATLPSVFAAWTGGRLRTEGGRLVGAPPPQWFPAQPRREPA